MENELISFIDSGILDEYVLGLTSADENAEVEAMATKHTEVKMALEAIELQLEQNGLANAVAPPELAKTFVMASVDYMGRLGGGEPMSFPPIMDAAVKITDYATWLEREDMVPPTDFTGAFAKIIGYTPQAVTAIVWVKDLAPSEVHDDEFESFLILEGSCNITIGSEMHHLVAGDFLAIPLFMPHQVQITSVIPCKVLLQRVAA